MRPLHLAVCALALAVCAPRAAPAQIQAAGPASPKAAGDEAIHPFRASARLYWESRNLKLTSAASIRTSEIAIPVAITVFPDEVVRAQETWARRAFPNLIYFHEADRGGHFAMWEHPELFAAELRAAFTTLRNTTRKEST